MMLGNLLPSPKLFSKVRSYPFASRSIVRLLTTNNTKIKLRPYQEECIQAVLDNLASGKKRLGISLATGSGKTVIFTHLIARVPARTENATQTLILVHRRELVEQAAKHCQEVYPNRSVEVEMGNIHASGSADITIASVLSIISPERLAKFKPERFKLVLVDEAHHIVASSYLRVLEHFSLDALSTDSPALVGVSATLSRFDGLSLNAALDHVVFHKDYIDMIEENWLANVIFTTVETKVDLRRVKSAASGDFLASSLSKAVNTRPTNELIVKAWKDKASERRSTIVFCVDVAHVQALTANFRDHGIDAKYIIGTDLVRDRDATLDAFRRGDFPVLLNCSIFTEGTDIPNIDCVLLARPTKSRNLLVQMVGRGMRLHKGKENCHVIDMVSSLDAGLVCTPTLFGLDPKEILNEDGIKVINKIKDARALEGEAGLCQSSGIVDLNPFQTAKYIDYDSVHDLLQSTPEERHIRTISALAWVQVAENRYILMNEDGCYLAIEQIGQADVRVRYTAKLPFVLTNSKANWKPLLKPREIAKAESMINAVHAADTFANEHFIRRIIAQHQRWRKDPATDGQLTFLNKMRGPEEQLEPSDITKGQAGDMITKIKFGAKGRYYRMKAGIKRQQRAEEKKEQLSEMRRREEVRVGAIS